MRCTRRGLHLQLVSDRPAPASCDPCPRPILADVASFHLPFRRAPTLSYTKQLEARVAQLEDVLSKVRGHRADSEARKVGSPASVAESSSSAGRRIKSENDDGQELAREFDGLNVENDGRISFHGPTSLFQLPSGVVNETASTSHFAHELEARKERLINSAWRERAFEQMAAMPVRWLLCLRRDRTQLIILRNRSNISSIRIGAGSSPCSTLSIALPLPVSSCLCLGSPVRRY